MKMSEEMAVRLHRMMWSDMQKELGDRPSCDDRLKFKYEWVKRNFPGERIANDCWLCEYTSSVRECSGSPYCSYCPISWPFCRCNTVDFSYAKAPISEILALPARNKIQAELPDICKKYAVNDETALVKSYYEYREELLSKASGIPASSPIDDHVKKIQEKATETFREASMLLVDQVNDYKDKLSEQSGLGRNRTVDDHIKAIKEKAVDEYFEKQPAAKMVSMDVDQAFKQYAKEQKEPIFKRLAEESGLDATATIKAHIDAIYSNGFDDGKGAERERILDKIGEMLNK